MRPAPLIPEPSAVDEPEPIYSTPREKPRRGRLRETIAVEDEHASIEGPDEERAFVKERHDEAHVHQMRAAKIGVVDNDNVARVKGLALLNGGIH